ncbi:MAG: hypothetical protein R6U64_00630 [Bacteroidales bacterium]
MKIFWTIWCDDHQLAGFLINQKNLTNVIRMKKYYRLLLLPLAFSLFLMQGCIDELGEDPFADPMEKFLGTWNVEESSTIYGDGFVYTVSITPNPQNSSEVLISNFYYQGDNVQARALIAGNVITIIEQSICDDSIIVKGSGTWISGRINLQYTANTGADLDEVSAVYTRP